MEELAIVFPIVGRGLASQDNMFNPIEAPDIFSVINRVKLQLNVDPPIIIALFNRSLALLLLCGEVELPREAFERCRPGKSLLIAASRTLVAEVWEEDGYCATPHFDTQVFLHAFRAASD